MPITQNIRLNDGHTIPQFGLGVYLAEQGPNAVEAILCALENGYRHIDTAAIYRNEESVGEAIRQSGIPREEIYVTTKLWRDDHGYDSAHKAMETSLGKLGLDYVDLYLSHWPTIGKRLDSWRAMQEMKETGTARSIGVSNYMVHHLKEIIEYGAIVPSVNQIEMHPFIYGLRKEVVDYCNDNKIAVEAYSPLTKGQKLDNIVLVSVAQNHSKTSAQVLIRWAIEKGMIVIPKSTNPNRIKENADVFDFELSLDEMGQLDGLNENLVTGWDPTNAL